VAAVLGPDRRGVVLLAEDSEVLGRLASAGLEVVTLGQEGLSISSAVAEADRAVHVAVAVRRPTLSSGPEDWVAAAPDGHLYRGTDPVLSALRAAEGRAPARVAVFGGAWIREDEPEYSEIRRLGGWLAEHQAHLVCGGYQGAMAAASRGVREAGGVAVGVTIDRWEEMVTVNEWLTHELVARDLFARLPVISDADAWVAFPGGVGTLQEVALCWNLVQTELARPRPLLLVGEAWDRKLRLFRELLRVSDPAHFDLVRPVASYDDMVEALAPAMERP
jgi:uncharacterized protein (TIGR00730 family)